MTADSAGPGGISGQDVVFRLDRGYRRPLLTRGLTLLGVAVLAAVVAGLGVIPAVTGIIAGIFAALALSYAARYAWVGRFRTTLTPQGIEVRGYRNHFVPWPEVTGVEVTGFQSTGTVLIGGQRGMHAVEVDPSAQRGLSDQLMGQDDPNSGFRARLATVRVARSHGHRLLLRAPMVAAWQSDPEFEDKVAVIRRWWQAYGPAMPGQARGPLGQGPAKPGLGAG
jgi:hypothetical protein